MKKTNKVMLFLCLKVLAADAFNVSVSSVTMNAGESKSISVTANNAAGRLNISSSNSKVATVSPSAIFVDNNSENIVVEAVSAGTAVITVVASKNFATYSDETILEGVKKTITINVIEEDDDEILHSLTRHQRQLRLQHLHQRQLQHHLRQMLLKRVQTIK